MQSTSTQPIQTKRPGIAALRAFQTPSYRNLMIASSLSMTAMAMMNLARGWLVLTLTDSPFWLGLTVALGGLPMLFFSMVGGVIADRFSRRKVLITGEVVNCCLYALLALLVFTDVVQVWHVLVISLLSGMAFAMIMPSRQSLVPTLVPREDLANAVALMTSTFSLSMMVGPALAGVAVAVLDIPGTFTLASLAVIPAIVTLSRLQTPPNVGLQANPLQNLLEGLRYTRDDPFIRSLLMMGAVITLFTGPREALMPVLARDVLHAGSEGLGVLLGSGGAGALAGSLIMASMASGTGQRKLMAGAGIFAGVAISGLALSPWFPLSAVFAALCGLSTQMFFTANVTAVQMAVPDELRGRVLSIRMIMFGLAPVGAMAAGAVAELIGAPYTLVGGGALCVALGLMMIRRYPALRGAEEAPLGNHPSPVLVASASSQNQLGSAD